VPPPSAGFALRAAPKARPFALRAADRQPTLGAPVHSLCRWSLIVVPLGFCLAGCRAPAGDLTTARAAAPAPRADTRFTDVAARMGLAFRWKTVRKAPLNILEISSAGAGFIDYDGDGWPDILLAGPEGCALFHNEGGQRFQNASVVTGLDRLSGRWHGCAVADVDNDGWPDLLITGYHRQALLRNEAGRRFVDLTARSGIASDTWGTSAAFFDADRDGRVDLLLGSYVRFGPGSPEFMNRNGVRITLGPDAYPAEPLHYFRSLGGFRFRDETRAAGFHVSRGKCFGIAVADFDDDGDDDVYVANDEMPGNLFVNDGRGRFTDRGVESGTALSGAGRRQGGMGTAWGDWDNDLRPDLVVTTFTQEPKSLYHNDGGGLFSDRSYTSQVTQGLIPWVGFGVLFADVNRDGFLDLAMVNGHVEDLIHQVDPANDYPQPMKLFLNRGDGTFEDASETTGDGFRRSIVGRALAEADWDNDGDPDFLAADLEGPPVLLRNEAPPGAAHWLGLHLVGTGKSNRMAIGARVTVKSAGRRQLREVRTDGSYLSAHDPRALFGLGADAAAPDVTVRWPDGTTQTARGMPPDRYYQWQEGQQPVPARF
jgi:enediyne biosynthesis protein E4